MKILLVDANAERRDCHKTKLEKSGYGVDAQDAQSVPADSSIYALTVYSMHLNPEDAEAYMDTLKDASPQQPVLLLTDYGAFVPHACLNANQEMPQIAKEVSNLLNGCGEVQELNTKT